MVSAPVVISRANDLDSSHDNLRQALRSRPSGSKSPLLSQRQGFFRGGLDAIAAAAFGLVERRVSRGEQDVQLGFGGTARNPDAHGSHDRPAVDHDSACFE